MKTVGNFEKKNKGTFDKIFKNLQNKTKLNVPKLKRKCKSSKEI